MATEVGASMGDFAYHLHDKSFNCPFDMVETKSIGQDLFITLISVGVVVVPFVVVCVIILQ